MNEWMASKRVLLYDSKWGVVATEREKYGGLQGGTDRFDRNLQMTRARQNDHPEGLSMTGRTVELSL